MATVVVVGGGPAGLVAARRLASADHRVTLVEAAERVGGRVVSDRTDGMTLDVGFQVLFTAYPAVTAELDLDALELCRFPPGAILAGDGGRTVLADPMRDPRAALETAMTREITLRDKLTVVRLVRRLRSQSPDSLLPGPSRSIGAHLETLGFSSRFIDRFASPFVGGITLDRDLTAAAGLFEYTFKMLAEGATAVPAAGMGAVTRQLADSARTAGVDISTGEPVRAVTPADSGVTVETTDRTLEADAAIVATDPPTAAELTDVASIPTEGVGCTTQYYRLPASVDLGTRGRLLLNTADAAPNHVVDLSSVAPSYAPSDARLLAAVFLEDTDGGTDVLAGRTRDALASWYPARSTGPLEVVATHRTPFAQFAQPPGIHDTLPSVDAPEGRIFLAGEYTAWSSIQGALESGRTAAATVHRELTDG